MISLIEKKLFGKFDVGTLIPFYKIWNTIKHGWSKSSNLVPYSDFDTPIFKEDNSSRLWFFTNFWSMADSEPELDHGYNHYYFYPRNILLVKNKSSNATQVLLNKPQDVSFVMLGRRRIADTMSLTRINLKNKNVELLIAVACLAKNSYTIKPCKKNSHNYFMISVQFLNSLYKTETNAALIITPHKQLSALLVLILKWTNTFLSTFFFSNLVNIHPIDI